MNNLHQQPPPPGVELPTHLPRPACFPVHQSHASSVPSHNVFAPGSYSSVHLTGQSSSTHQYSTLPPVPAHLYATSFQSVPLMGSGHMSQSTESNFSNGVAKNGESEMPRQEDPHVMTEKSSLSASALVVSDKREEESFHGNRMGESTPQKSNFQASYKAEDIETAVQNVVLREQVLILKCIITS